MFHNFRQQIGDVNVQSLPNPTENPLIIKKQFESSKFYEQLENMAFSRKLASQPAREVVIKYEATDGAWDLLETTVDELNALRFEYDSKDKYAIQINMADEESIEIIGAVQPGFAHLSNHYSEHRILGATPSRFEDAVRNLGSYVLFITHY